MRESFFMDFVRVAYPMLLVAAVLLLLVAVTS